MRKKNRRHIKLMPIENVHFGIKNKNSKKTHTLFISFIKHAVYLTQKKKQKKEWH